MKKIGFALAVCTILAVCGCTENDENSNNIQELNGTYLFGSISDEIKAKLPLETVKSIPDIGLYPSDIEIYGDYAYIVDSGHNAINRIHLETWTINKAYIDLGQNAAPFAVHANDKAIYVSCQGTPTAVYRFDLQNNLDKTTVFEQMAIEAPTDITTFGNDLPIVLDSQYNYEQMTAKGTIYTADSTRNPQSLKTNAENPVFAETLNTDNGTHILVVSAGVVTWSTETIPPEISCLELFDPATPTSITGKLCMPHTSLGRIAISGQRICVGNGLKSQIHCVSQSELTTADTFPQTISIHGDDTGLTTPIAIDDHTWVVTDFNHDTVNWIQDDSVLNLRLSPSNDALKGPIDAVYDAKRKQILILNSTSSSVDVLKIK